MDKLNYYRQCLREFLTQYASYGSQDQNMETQLIFDTENDHYQYQRSIEFPYFDLVNRN